MRTALKQSILLFSPEFLNGISTVLVGFHYDRKLQTHFWCACFITIITIVPRCPCSLCQQSSIPKWGVPLCRHTPVPRQCLTGSVQIWLGGLWFRVLLKEECRNQIVVICVQFLSCKGFVPDFHYKPSSGQPPKAVHTVSPWPFIRSLQLRNPLIWQHIQAHLPPSSVTNSPILERQS